MQVRITDQAPNQKRKGEMWAWGHWGGGGPEGPPNVTEGAGQAPPQTGRVPLYVLSSPLRDAVVGKRRFCTAQNSPRFHPLALKIGRQTNNLLPS